MSWKEVLTLPEAQVGIVIYNYVEYLKTSIAFLQNIKTHFHIQYIFFFGNIHQPLNIFSTIPRNPRFTVKLGKSLDHRPLYPNSTFQAGGVWSFPCNSLKVPNL